MFNYTNTYNRMIENFNTDSSTIFIPDEDIRIDNVEFSSSPDSIDFHPSTDLDIKENYNFSYPVFSPAGGSTSKKAIFLFHGLNERSWNKYLTWAYYLSKETDSYVILFPISFHINRTPASWLDPRKLFQRYCDRRLHMGNIDKSSLSNVTLSNRLCEQPLRFFSSGYQTINDILTLTNSIKNGTHPIIPKCDVINIFAYSIGAFMAQIIMISNYETLFSNSKLFIFSGGSIFRNMHGTSKYIMDKMAYDKIYDYYLNDFEKLSEKKTILGNIIKYNKIALAFRAMLDLNKFKAFRENIFKKLKENILAISLKKDSVIPSKGVVETLSSWDKTMTDTVKIWDFPYQYSHENPFPIFKTRQNRDVDNCFIKVFSTAVSFFNT